MDILNTDFQLVSSPPESLENGDADGVPTSEKRVSSVAQGSPAARLRAFYLAEQASEGDASREQSPGVGGSSRGVDNEEWQTDSYGKVGKVRALCAHTVILSQRTLKNYSRCVPG